MVNRASAQCTGGRTVNERHAGRARAHDELTCTIER